MEKIQCICGMRDLVKALSQLEIQLEENYGVTLNEAMVLCSVGGDTVSAGDITACTGMTPSHASKTIRSVEDKGLLTRKLGEHDKRQMYFALTRKGKNCLGRIKEQGVDAPEWLAPLLNPVP
ncbi:MAG: MarR family transcriptional regulator [Candidatus Bacteroides intestinipullorum]|uniref:MarR family transcriptional regulator n=1 Tax=Candidatus Bacteroides intestinipullorum TaxID=2838471 RepID=A0A9E2KFR9_9BACE|nr:MarR family transcriptional regulator [Candidatus Bacteroides intestinipullorum]